MPAFQNLAQLEDLARRRMSKVGFEYYVGGAEDEVAVRSAREAFGKWVFRPRMLTGGGDPDMRLRILGAEAAFPVLVAPTAFHGLAHPDKELATARGTHDAGSIFTASTSSNASLEDIAASCAGPKWFQLYMQRDRKVSERLVTRAGAAGYKAIMLTVDVPVAGRRERDLRVGFHLPPGLDLGNLKVRIPKSGQRNKSGLVGFIANQQASELAWSDVDSLRGLTKLPIILKGILTAEDAELAVRHGASAIVVSNHGGRQLDHSIAPLDALPEVVAAVKGKVPVLVDGGIQRGTDVLKALALGANATMLGRPVLWGLALGGREGVRAVLEHLRHEVATSMRLLGAHRLADLGPQFLARA